MLLLILLLIFIILLVANYFYYKKELTSPSIIFCLTYTLSIFCALLNIKNWNINFHINTFLVLLIGGIIFVTTSNIIYSIYNKKYKNNKPLKINKIEVPRIILMILVFYDIIILLILLKNVLMIAAKYGDFNTLPQALNLYKNFTSYEGVARLPNYLTILLKPLMAGAYIGILVFVNNFIYNKMNKIKKDDNYKYLIFPLLYVIERYLESNRGATLNLLIALIVIIILIWSISNNWKKIIQFKTILLLGLSGILALFVFYLSAGISGRVTDKKPFDYITMYVGGSIECFNLWMQEPDEVRVVHGEYTFSRTISDLNEIGITDYKLENINYSKRLFYEDVFIGNIYTSYRSWIHDYGYIGAIILQIILASIITILYCVIRFNTTKNQLFFILLYGYTIYTIFMHPVDSYFYLEMFTKSNIAVILMMTIMYIIIIKYNKYIKKHPNITNKYIIIEGKYDGKYNATNKAREDVEEIVESLSFKRYQIPTINGIRKNRIGKILQILTYIKNNIVWDYKLSKLKKGDIVFIQYPLINTTLLFDKLIEKYNKRLSFILLIHDLDSLRFKNNSKSFYKRKKYEDKHIINKANYIICHNESMKKVINNNGKTNNVITLNIFDYLSKDEIKNNKISQKKPIIIAGNLSPEKGKYMFDLKKVNINFNLYGINYDEKYFSKNVKYQGAYKPDELLYNLKGSFGLVWDGEKIDTIKGGFGEYLKYNNPHKVSMYLAAGIPVIVWDQSAMAKFVKDNNVGITISSLYDIPKKLSKIDNKSYLVMKKNCKKISNQLIKGYYLKKAVGLITETR